MSAITWPEPSGSVLAREVESIASELPRSLHSRWVALERHLLTFHSLGDDWDGLGAETPSPETVDLAFSLLRFFKGELPEPPRRVAPTPDGAIVFEWQNPKGWFGVEVQAPASIETFPKRGHEALELWQKARDEESSWGGAWAEQLPVVTSEAA